MSRQTRLLFLITLFFIVVFLGKNLNPFNNQMFEFHDETQAARVQQFTLNLKNLKIPPRLAPDFSYKMGYPVFNFYAPSSYWITGFINLIGFDTVSSLKLSFLLSIILAFVFAFLFLRCFFDFYPSLLGGVLYIASIYFPVNIFVRGNLGETWFLTLFPLALYLLYKNSQKANHYLFFITVIILSAVYSVHNLLSLIFIPVSLIYLLLLKNKKINLISIAFALLLSAYFLIPMILESPLTYAREVAALTDYRQHFLCLYQLWDSPWGFGGSAPDCINDGMSFKLGKLQIIFALLGVLIFLTNLFKNKIKKELILRVTCYMLFLTISSLLMTTYPSQFIWTIFSPILSLIQFPWRFTSFSLLGLVFLLTYFWQTIRFRSKNIVIFLLIILGLIIGAKYFYRQPINKTVFENKYLSQEYIEKVVAYKIPEYLPKTADYQTWRTGIDFNYLLPIETREINYQLIKNLPFEKIIKVNSGLVIINIHYFPFWRISIDGKIFIPNKFDQFGRPVLSVNKPSIIKIAYRQTLTESMSNLITVLTFICLLVVVERKILWKRLTA